MNQWSYERVRLNRPDLELPMFCRLNPVHRELLRTLSPERLIARRTAVILSRENMLVPDPTLAPIGPEES